MKTIFGLFWLCLLLAACSPKPQAKDATTLTSNALVTGSGESAKAAPKPEALKTDEILSCDRRSVLYDESKHKKAEPPPLPRAMTMKPGDTGYIGALVSNEGRVYINGYDQIAERPDENKTTMIRRVTDGFLVDCDSAELWVFLNEGATNKADKSDLIPVIGHIDVKPKKVAKTLTTPTIGRVQAGDILVWQQSTGDRSANVVGAGNVVIVDGEQK